MNPVETTCTPTLPRALSGTVTSVADGVARLSLTDGRDAVLPASEMSATTAVGDRVVVVALDETDVPTVSSAHQDLVASLLSALVPAVADGTVRIMGVVRVPGERTKVAVAATVADLDPVAAVVGHGSVHLRAVAALLAPSRERVDVVAWHPDRAVYLDNALKPAVVVDVEFPSRRQAVVRVRPHQMASAVGKGGLNAQLAGHLVDARVRVEPAA